MSAGAPRPVAYRPSPDVVVRNIAGEHLLVPVRNGAAQMDFLFTADEVGSFIFALLDGRRTTEEIAREMTRVFEVTVDRAREDAAEFLEALRSARLIEPAEESAR